jgi:uncharacterized pyridoxamine 5'-phosphate oxidase family protein
MNTLTAEQTAFLAVNHAAAMITVEGGVAKAVRVAIALVDGKIWSSGNAERVRTARLRKDPRCTLYVHDNSYKFLTLESHVRLIEGPQVPELSLRLFRVMQNRPEGAITWFGQEMTPEAFMASMAADKRLIYEFDLVRAYGMI